MEEFQNEFQHFILTRFNLLLWHKDKEGRKVRTRKWLEHRFSLFERYCLPSIKNQSCQNFEWIVLFDSTTPEEYKERIEGYKRSFPQLAVVFVEPENGRYFAQIFRNEIIKRLKSNRVISTYLDNDDALDASFAKDVQQRALQVADGTFIRYRDGYQYYTDHQYLMRIQYPRNHFISIVEKGDTSLKGIFGYGSHIGIGTIKGVKILEVEDVPIWCEVIHDRNMINDAYFLWRSKIVCDREWMRQQFSIEVTLNTGFSAYVFRFLPRYVKTFFRRTKNYLFGTQW